MILGLIERLPAGEGHWRNDTIARQAAAIKATIVEASNEGVGQGPRVFAPLGRFISTEMPGLFTDIFRQIPVPVLESLGAHGDCFAWAEIYSEAARIPGVDAAALRAEALRFAGQLRGMLIADDHFSETRLPSAARDYGKGTDGAGRAAQGMTGPR